MPKPLVQSTGPTGSDYPNSAGSELYLVGRLFLLAYLFSQHLVALFIMDGSVVGLTETLLHVMMYHIVCFGWSDDAGAASKLVPVRLQEEGKRGPGLGSKLRVQRHALHAKAFG